MTSPEASHVGLVGRSPETTLIESLLAFGEDAPRAVLFRGDPGVGKTALLDLASRRARDDGARVVTVRGSEYESDIAYSGLNQAVVALEPYLDLLTPQQGDALRVVFGSSPLANVPDRLTVYSAASALFGAAGRSRRLLVCLDDVQWFDRVSAEGFFFVARRLEETQVSIIATARSAPGWLDDGAGLRVHDVQPLDKESANLLLRQRFPGLAARIRQRLLDDAEGNPLALLELPHALEQSGSDAEQLPTQLPLTRRLLVMFTRRIESLPEETRDLLLTSALEGTGDLNVLRRALGDSSLGALTAAEDAGIVKLSATADRIIFRHPLMTSAVAEHATGAQRREAHRRLADAFPRDIDRRARHLAAATWVPDESVAQILHAAARRAAERGVDGDDAAMRLLIRSADLSPSPDDQRMRMAEAAYIGALRYASPAPELLERVADPRPGSDEALWAASATAFISVHRTNDLPATFRLLDSALDAAVVSGNTASDAYAAAVQTHFLLCTLGDGAAHSEQFEAWLDAIPASPHSEQFQVMSAMLDPARSASALIPIVDRAIEQAVTSTDPRVIGIATGGAVYLDRLSRCRAALQRVADLGPQGAGEGDIPVRVQLSVEAFFSGRWDETLRIAQGGIELSERRSTALGTALFNQRRALVAAVRGDSRTAAALADSILSDLAGRGYLHIEHEVRFAMMLDAVGREDHAAAFAAASTISAPGDFPRSGPLALWVFFELVSSAVRLGRIDDATRHVEELRHLEIAAISPHYALMVAASEAMLLDRSEQSAAHLASYVEQPDVEKWPFDLARIRLLQAEFLIATGRSAEASIQIRQALVTFRELGALPWIVLAGRLGGRTTGAHQNLNGLSLTSTELKVVRLAATGMTNKEIGTQLFLSARTVASHLYRAFPKLGIERRAALRDAVARLDDEAQRAPSGDRHREGLVGGNSHQ